MSFRVSPFLRFLPLQLSKGCLISESFSLKLPKKMPDPYPEHYLPKESMLRRVIWILEMEPNWNNFWDEAAFTLDWEQNKAELSMSCWAATLSKNKWQLVNEILRLQKLLIKQPAARTSTRALLRRPGHCTALKKESTAKAHCPELFLTIVKFLQALSYKSVSKLSHY
jgi:hypothetical protein